MGRPKKVIEGAEAPEQDEAAAPVVTEMPVADSEPVKPCPKCGAKSTGPYKDVHGNYRCNCSDPRCGFWDSQVYNSADEAKKGWQLAGGPNPEGYF